MVTERLNVSARYRDLYDGYYENSTKLIRKRELSARSTVRNLVHCLATTALGSRPRLLDVGAGDGSVLAELHNRNFTDAMYAVEISASGVESIKSREIPTLRNVSQFDGYQIPYPEKFFDLAIVAHVLEHVEHERIFLREISRVCKFAYIEVPLEHGLFVTKSVKNGPKFGHINFYSIETFVDLLRSSGMSVEASSVESPSIDYERLLSGPTRGTIKKNTFRRAMLRLAPRLSPWAMQYNGYSLCRCD